MKLHYLTILDDQEKYNKFTWNALITEASSINVSIIGRYYYKHLSQFLIIFNFKLLLAIAIHFINSSFNFFQNTLHRAIILELFKTKIITVIKRERLIYEIGIQHFFFSQQ